MQCTAWPRHLRRTAQNNSQYFVDRKHREEVTNICGAADLAARAVIVIIALGLRSSEPDCGRYGEEKLCVQNHLLGWLSAVSEITDTVCARLRGEDVRCRCELILGKVVVYLPLL